MEQGRTSPTLTASEEGSVGYQYRQFKAIQIMSRALPRRLMYWVGDRCADISFATDLRARRAVEGNIRRIRAFGGVRREDHALQAMAREVFRGLGRNFVDFFHFTRLSPGAVRRLFAVEGLEFLQSAYARGRGVIALSGHIGPYEMGALGLIALGYPVSLVARQWDEPRADALFVRQRNRRGVKVILLGNAARGSLDALRRHDILAILGDFDYTLRDDRMRFLDGDSRLPLGPARLCVKTGAPIVPLFVTRRPDRGYLMRFQQPIVPDGSSTVSDVQAGIIRVLEEKVRASPEQWLLFSDVWDCARSLEIARKGFVIFTKDDRGRGEVHPHNEAPTPTRPSSRRQ